MIHSPRILHGRLWQTACAVFSLIASLAAGTLGAHGASLESQLKPLIEAHRGKAAVAVKHLDTGEGFAYRDSTPMPTASLIKFPVMIEAYRQAADGRVDLDEMLTLRDTDKAPGSGILTPHFSAGAKVSLRDAIHLMIVYSDNTATNLVLDRIGIESTAKTMADMGFPNTKIHAKVFRRDTSVFPERSREFGLGSTTAAEMMQLCELLHGRKLAEPAACEEMLSHLLACEDRAKLPRLLPEGAKVAHKSGSVSRVRCDAGIVYSPKGPIAICVLTNENEDRSWGPDNAGERLCAEIAAAAYRHFNPPTETAAASVPSVLKSGDSGRLVESLQRTLNARLSPSPDLSVDGDFGPMTRAAVVRFQESKGLTATGEVGPETWSALGALVTEDPPVPDPRVVNEEQLTRAPAEDLSGPPIVTCKAWAVADGKTGRLLWSANEDKPLDFASTTKIMAAYIVIESAESRPDVLDEEIVFSKRADEVNGSTAGVRAGERLPVRELLYGLLLPSGNDAALALAEHFGARFPAPEDRAEESDPLVRFVAEMNRTAQRLKMKETKYANPHGLTEEGHLSSARDLARLASLSLQKPLFRQYVNTRQRGCALVGPGGYRRNVVWKNTNRLLGIEGYDGVKTGTTTAAGACLISSGRRGDDHLIVVVLGATSSDARYVDARNLFRWAWRQRPPQTP